MADVPYAKKEARMRLVRVPETYMLDALSFLSRVELLEMQEVSARWDNMVVQNSAPIRKGLPQRRIIYAFSMELMSMDRPNADWPCLDLDKWQEADEDMETIKDKAEQLQGQRIYPHVEDNCAVSIALWVNEDSPTSYELCTKIVTTKKRKRIKNRLDAESAFLMARLVNRLAACTFERIFLDFKDTPEPADGGSLLNRAIFSLPDGKPLTMVTRVLEPMCADNSHASAVKTLQGLVECETLHCYYPSRMTFDNFVHMAASCRSFVRKEALWVSASAGDLNRFVKFFRDVATDLRSTVPSACVSFAPPARPPHHEISISHAFDSAGEEDGREDCYTYTFYNVNSGEEFTLKLDSRVIDERTGTLEVREATLLFHQAGKHSRGY